jgi:hypothetical protein
MEATMTSGRDLWKSADEYAGRCGAQSAKAMRFYALGKMLAEAESAGLTECDVDAAEHLRELQAHCEKLIALLAPDKKVTPSLIAAA